MNVRSWLSYQFCTLSLVCVCILFQGAIGAATSNAIVQQQIKEFQKESRKLGQDSSGLILPPNPGAIKWIHEFRTTGLHRTPPVESLNRNPVTTQDYSLTVCQSHDSPNVFCGVHNSTQTYLRQNVLIVPVGNSWRAEKWLDRPENATFDVIALYHGDDFDDFHCSLCAKSFHIKGPKWRVYYQFTSSSDWKDVAEKYQYVMLPDDDLEIDTCSLNTVFETMRRYDLILGQPSVCEGHESGTWRPDLHQRLQFELRYTTFVEVMAPTYRMDFFDKVVRWTFSEHWTYVGWGLDSVWPALLGYPKDRIAVIDAVCVTHVPTPGGLGSNGKPESVYRPGLSPFSPKDEENIVFQAYNYDRDTTKAFGEPFMGLRIVGGVVNKEVACAMTRTLGAPWPGSTITFSSTVRTRNYLYVSSDFKSIWINNLWAVLGFGFAILVVNGSFNRASFLQEKI